MACHSYESDFWYSEVRKWQAIYYLVGGFTPKPLLKGVAVMKRLRSHPVSFRLSDEEYEKFKIKLSKSKLTQTEFFIQAINNQKIMVINSFVPILTELKRQGVNLNQLTHYKNEYSAVTEQELNKSLHDCRVIYRKLYQLADKINNLGE